MCHHFLPQVKSTAFRFNSTPNSTKMIYCRLLIMTMIYTAAHCSSTNRSQWTPEDAHSTPSVSQCDTGEQRCCNSLQKANSPEVYSLAQSLGLKILDKAMVGIDCTFLFSTPKWRRVAMKQAKYTLGSPLLAAVAGGSSCSQQPVCCDKTEFVSLWSLSPLVPPENG